MKRQSKKPGISYRKEYTLVQLNYKTYDELKKDLKNHLNESDDGKVHVYRTRRGEWGEWFEIWQKGYKKPVKQGWQ